MRALNKGWIGIVLVILFGASLFFFRGSSRYSNLFNSDNFVASVSGTPISTSQFLRTMELNIGQFAQMIGEELSGDQIRAFQIHQLVLQNLVNNAIFENEFDKLNFILDESVVAKKTKERFPNLYINNKINDDALNSFLSQQRLKIEDVVNIINYETRSNVFDNLFFNKNYPLAISHQIDNYNNHIRKIDLLTISFNEIVVPDLNESSISDDNQDLLNFYEQNSVNYMSAEKRDLSYIAIDKENFRKDFIPSENEIAIYFKENKNLFIIPERRSFKQFNFKTINEAKDFKIKITGMSNSEIISFASNNNIIFNDFEDVNRNQVLDELSNAIFSLNNNEVSDVVQTTLAYHLILLDDVKQEREQELDEVYDEIKNTLTNVELNNYFGNLKLEINQQILDGLSLDEIAQKNNLTKENINNALQNNETDDFINIIVNSAFSQNKDFISDVIDFNSNKSFIINVNDVYPSTPQQINEVFDEILSDFIKSKKIDYANNIFNDATSENNFDSIKNVFNASSEEKDIKLNSKDLPSFFVVDIFSIDLNEISFSSDEDNIYFAKIKDIQMPTDNESSQNLNLLAELKNAFGNEIIKAKNISINDELINGILSQYK